MMANGVELVKLAAEITAAAERLQSKLQDGNLTFTGMPTIQDDDTIAARLSLIQSSRDIIQLVQGPLATVQSVFFEHHIDTAALDALVRLGIPEAVPVSTSVPFAAISKTTGVAEVLVKRLVRYATTLNVFEEGPRGVISHTDASKTLLPTAPERAFLDMGLDVGQKLDGKFSESLVKWSYEDGEPNQTAFNLAFDTDLPFYKWYGLPANKGIASTLYKMLKARAEADEWNERHVSKSKIWDNLKANAMVVDLGGGEGGLSTSLAQRYSTLHFVVQDLPQVVDAARSKLAADLQGVITFESHNFFEPQPETTTGADVYLLRLILHNWSDRYCRRILCNIVAAMEGRPGSRLVIVDAVLPEPGTVTKVEERRQRGWDLRMLSLFQGAERDLEGWEDLMKSADERLKIETVERPEGSALSIITAQLTH